MATFDGGATRHAICLTGPESTGKTTLARALAAHLGAQLVPEVARNYLAGHSGYTAQDVLRIALRQAALEAEVLACGGVVICDTDLLVIQIWWREKFGELPAELVRALNARSTRCYLLLQPDLPWVADPLRENPDDRDRLFDGYQRELENSSFPFAVVGGTGKSRLVNALAAISRLTGHAV